MSCEQGGHARLPSCCLASPSRLLITFLCTDLPCLPATPAGCRTPSTTGRQAGTQLTAATLAALQSPQPSNVLEPYWTPFTGLFREPGVGSDETPELGSATKGDNLSAAAQQPQQEALLCAEQLPIKLFTSPRRSCSPAVAAAALRTAAAAAAADAGGSNDPDDRRLSITDCNMGSGSGGGVMGTPPRGTRFDLPLFQRPGDMTPRSNLPAPGGWRAGQTCLVLNIAAWLWGECWGCCVWQACPQRRCATSAPWLRAGDQNATL